MLSTLWRHSPIALLQSCLVACGLEGTARDGALHSLDGNSANKKHYLGWGEYLSGFMGNETKYDVKHTHDIFTSGAGGGYKSTTLVDRQFSGRDVKAAMDQVSAQVAKDDMYVQYSSGHGFPGGLGIGLEYSTIVQNALTLPAKEVVVFLMACHSGGLVDQFNKRKSEWQDWRAKGRTLFVMSSSTVEEQSSTGPGTDTGEQGPSGSAGSAYGHALWKTLIGEADGYLDGVKDGFVSLGEIAAYATEKTKRVGGHTPQVTGAYDPMLIMNKVPNRDAISQQQYEGGTGGMSEREVKSVVAKSDAALQREIDKALAAGLR